MIFYRYLIFLISVLNHPTNKNHQLKTMMRIIWWKINTMFFHLPCFIELAPGIKCICYPHNSHYSTLVVYNTFPEYGEMMFVKNILRSDDVFIDIGANIGAFSLLAASKITNGKIYAFEPSPHILPILKQNIALNNKFDRIEIEKVAASDKEGNINFDISETPDYNHIVSSNEVKRKSINILTKTIDFFLKRKNISHVKLIKIDVEGAEMIVLKGMQKSLQQRKVDALIIEVNKLSFARFGFSVKDMRGYLEDFGYNLYMFNNTYELVKFEEQKNKGWNLIALNKYKEKYIKTSV